MIQKTSGRGVCCFAQDQKGADIGETYERKRIPSRRLEQATTHWLIVLHVESLRLGTVLLNCCPQQITDVKF